MLRKHSPSYRCHRGWWDELTHGLATHIQVGTPGPSESGP
uniref:Uncharacterized protein n=1 Tax=Arundo donax TaxID=35708 RepID=A0A0A9SLP8_ARUDO